MSVIDEILESSRDKLVGFNDEVLIDFREYQVTKSAEYMSKVYKEILTFLPGVKYLGYTLTTPEERIEYMLGKVKGQAKKVDISPTDLSIFKYIFEFEGQKYYSYVHLPFLRNNAITISGSKYYLQLVIVDNMFFYVPNGAGVKVLRGPIKFWRNARYSYTSMTGKVYTDDIITTQVHFKVSKDSSKRGLMTTLLLYILIYHGFEGTLELFHIPKDHVQFVLKYDPKDQEHEYFRVRGVCLDKGASVLPTQQELLTDEENISGFFVKVHRDTLNSEDQTVRRVVASIMYNMQYFEKCNSTIYQSNQELVDHLSHYDTVWKIILGKTIFGMGLEREAQAKNFAEQHWDMLDESYIDSMSRERFASLGFNFTTTHELFYYMFVNIDKYVVNQAPMNLYGKKLAVNEILLSGNVEAIFKKLYDHSKRKQPLTPKDLASILRAGNREIMKIFKHDALVRASVQFYNDNWLIAIGCKKIRATGSGNGNMTSGGGKNRRARKSTATRKATKQPEYAAHSSAIAVESLNSYSSQNPGAGGVINPCMVIDDVSTGVIIQADFQQPLDEFDTFINNR